MTAPGSYYKVSVTGKSSAVALGAAAAAAAGALVSMIWDKSIKNFDNHFRNNMFFLK